MLQGVIGGVLPTSIDIADVGGGIVVVTVPHISSGGASRGEVVEASLIRCQSVLGGMSVEPLDVHTHRAAIVIPVQRGASTAVGVDAL